MEAQRENEAGDHRSGSDDNPRTEELHERAVEAWAQPETWSASGEVLFVREAITRSYK